MIHRIRFILLTLLTCIIGVNTAFASLESSYTYNGRGNWSLDGVGSNVTQVGTIDAVVPAGSTVERAFLYSSLNNSTTVPTVSFDGTVISGYDWTPLGVANYLQAFRVDVTAQVAAKTLSVGMSALFVQVSVAGSYSSTAFLETRTPPIA